MDENLRQEFGIFQARMLGELDGLKSRVVAIEKNCQDCQGWKRDIIALNDFVYRVDERIKKLETPQASVRTETKEVSPKKNWIDKFMDKIYK
jgi:hypothetical protein